jgi:hypothetical protein
MIVLPASDPRAITPLSNSERRRLWRWLYDSLPLEMQLGENLDPDNPDVTSGREPEYEDAA